MSKRVSLNDRLKDDNKASKAVAAYISTKEDVNNELNNDGIIDEIENTDTNDSSNENVDVNIYKNANTDVNNSVSVDVGVDSDVSRIVIRKQSKQEVAKRATYYLLPNTIRKIEKLSKETGVG